MFIQKERSYVCLAAAREEKKIHNPGLKRPHESQANPSITENEKEGGVNGFGGYQEEVPDFIFLVYF
jgi:hypothetical protein